MLHKHKAIILAFLALVIASLACGPTLTSSGGPSAPVEELTLELEEVTAEPAEPAASEEPAEPAPNPDELCPQAGADTALYRSDESGFCFLYPAEFSESPDWDPTLSGGVTVLSPPLDPEAIESLNSYAQVVNTGPAGALSSAALYADAWAAAYFPPEFQANFTRSEATIGGQPAVVLGNIPGRVAGRSAFLVANGYRYHISIFPQPGDFENLDAVYGGAWEAITESIVFYAPSSPVEAVLAEDVCPAAVEGTYLHVSASGGYCFLVPTAFAMDDTGGYNSSWFTAGDPFDTGTDFGEMRARVVFAYNGPSDGLTAMQLTEDRVAGQNITRQQLTVGGYDAVEYIVPSGPVASRNLIVVVGDSSYSLVSNPYNPTDWPEAVALQDQGWESIVNSLTFFDSLR